MSSASAIPDVSSAAPLRTALVGLGRIGYKYHLPAIRRHAGYQLVGVVDPMSERRSEAAAGCAVPGFATLEPLLADLQPELVVIASPTPFHVEQACAAYASGAHVFCDKPVATSVAGFETIIAAAARAGKKFLAYQPARLRPEVQALQALLRRGILGGIHLVKRARCSFERRRDWQAFRANGGGMLNNYGSHCLDEWIALFGEEEVSTLFCQTRHVATAGDAEDVVNATLVTARGRILNLDISQACALPGPAWQVMGARGAALFDTETGVWRVRYFSPEEAQPLTAQTGLAAEGRAYSSEKIDWREEQLAAADFPEIDYYDAAWRYFRGGQPPPVTVDESRRLLQLIERCRHSAGTGAVA